MAYAAYTDVEVRVKTTMTATQQTRCNSLLTQVSDFIDGYLGSRYDVPFAATYPRLVVEACILLTSGEYLLGEMVQQPQVEVVELRARNYLERGERLLLRLLSELVLLAGSTAVVRDGDEAVGPAVRVSVSSPSITLQDSSSWKAPTASSALSIRPGPQENP